MTFSEQMVINILFMIAKHFCKFDEKLQQEIKDLQTHVKVYGGKAL